MPRDGSPLRSPSPQGLRCSERTRTVEGEKPRGRLLSRLRKLGWKGPAEQGSVKATEGSGAGKGEGLLITGEVLPTLQQATRVIVAQGLPSLPEGLKVHAEAAQELGAGINLRRGRSVKAIRVRGACLMRTASRLAKRSGWSLRGLSRRRCGRLLTALSHSSTSLRGYSLMSAARRCQLGGGPLGLRRLMPPCSTT